MRLIEDKIGAEKSDILCRPGKFTIDDRDIQDCPDTLLKVFGHVLVTQADHNLMTRGTSYMGYSLLFEKILEHEEVQCRNIPEYEFIIEAKTFELVVKKASGDVERVIRF